MSAPRDEYTARLGQWRDAHRRLSQIDARFAYARLGVFGLAVLLVVAAARGLAPFYVLLVPVLVFAVLVRRHDTTIRARDAAARAMAFYERGLARIEDRWAGSGMRGDAYHDDRHLYANDLDLFGDASLFQLLATARTQPGQDLLASWLKSGAGTEEIHARQDAIRELTHALDLREALASIGVDAKPETPREPLVRWARVDTALTPGLHGLVLAFAAVSVTALLLSPLMGTLMPALVIGAVQALVATWLRPRLLRAVRGTDAAAHDLDILAHLLARLEQERFASPKLSRLRQQLDTSGRTASGAIRALDRLVEMHDWHHNPYFRLVSLPLMWRLQLAFAIERWRRRHGADVAVWIETVAEVEALASLAAYAYEHPDDPFPVIDVAAGGHGARFDARGLGHPLLPAASMVRNDVTLDDSIRLVIISGSNMSGKSTLLRTVGINAVLALAGAPVRAVSLRLSPLALGATLRIQDSLQEGRSRFYAEITRIRALAETARGPVPLLFLLDELFHGTNSHDRLVGASGVLRSLLDRGAIGLITTHDLALTAVADELAPRAVNAHFEDWFDGGEMRFDYRMKPGPVTRSNALALMRAVGLDV